jgi:ribosomal protein L31
MKKLIISTAVLIAIGSAIGSAFYYNTVEEVEITVSDKEHVMYRNGDQLVDKYLVYTEGEVFENTDDLFRLKFNSSDVQNELKVDSTYNVEVIGWRIPFLSMHRNIIAVK